MCPNTSQLVWRSFFGSPLSLPLPFFSIFLPPCSYRLPQSQLVHRFRPVIFSSDQQSGHIQFGSPANIFCIGEFLHIGMYCTSCIFIIVLSPNFPCLRWATHRSRDGVGFLGSQGCALCRQIVSRKDNLNPTGEARCPGARLVAQMTKILTCLAPLFPSAPWHVMLIHIGTRQSNGSIP